MKGDGVRRIPFSLKKALPPAVPAHPGRGRGRTSRDESACFRGATHVQRQSLPPFGLLLREGYRGRLRPRSRAVFPGSLP